MQQNIVSQTVLGVDAFICTWLNVWTVSNFAQQLPTTHNNMQQGVQTDATCNIQQCWDLLANEGASIYTGIYCLFSEAQQLRKKTLQKKKTSTFEKQQAFWAGCPFWRDLIYCIFDVRTEKLVCKAARKRTQHCWMLLVASVDKPCCMLLRVVAQSLKPVKLFSQQLPTFLLFRDRRSVAQQCWICLHSSSNIVGAAHAHYAWFTKTYGLHPSHDALQVQTLLGVVASVCTPQLPTLLAQQCWELLWPFARSLKPRANRRNIVGQQLPTSLRPFAHPVGCCCAKFETGQTFEHSTPNISLICSVMAEA